jgi:prephenate dehydratase
MRVAYLGPPGTFSQEALGQCDLARDGEHLPAATFADAYDMLLRGDVDAALLPIENSVEGAVGAILDLLVHRPGPLIRREVALRVRQHLLVRPGTQAEGIQRILSHPQPFGQCARFLSERFPRAVREPTLSTAEAARRVAAGEPGAAAIGSQAAAKLYGL